jgi:uncharacterized RDD family membrane protein YckC|tara:strand:- start:6 stop:389 length:384 start_codon:yes stop_codon:yes gene_type:complete
MNTKVGLFKRLLVNFYDLILLFAVLYFFTIPIILLSKGNAVLDNIFYQTYLIAIIFLYYAWFWKRYNQTLGMRIWKIKIYSRYSLEISYMQSLKRIIVSLLGGHILLLVSNESLQDKISQTYLERVD